MKKDIIDLYAEVVVISLNASSRACFCSGVKTLTHAWKTSGFCSSCFTMPSNLVASGCCTGIKSRTNTSDIIDKIRGRCALLAPRITGWFAWIKSHRYPYTWGASSSSSITGSQENLQRKNTFSPSYFSTKIHGNFKFTKYIKN